MSTTARRSFAPKDRTKREHVGLVDAVVWASDDDTRVIVALTDGAKVLGPGARSQFAVGQKYRFHGRWSDGKFGPEFVFDTHTTDDPHTSAGVTKYLSEVCRGVGRKTADALWQEFGPDAVRILREEPAKVVAAGILSETAASEAAEDLTKFVHLEKTRVDLFGLFAGRGIGGKAIERCISAFGVAAPAKIRRNPYVLLTSKIPGCGFRRCDKLFLELGGRPDALKRQALAGWNAFKDDRTGSTWLTVEEAKATILGLIPRGDPIRALVLLRRAGWIRVKKVGESRFVALRDRADAEQRIADHIRRLNKAASAWPTALLTSVSDGDGLPSTHQAGQFAEATRKAVGCFIGGPGTGKTHTLSFALKQVIADHGPYSLAACAPTGKAASRMTETLRARGLPVAATTIHQLLEIGRNGHDGDGWGFLRDESNPLEARFLIVDETSMVDTTLFADLLSACADGTQVLFVGDPHQLPPVGHGAPLRDTIASGMVPFGELTEVRRNAGTIVRACAAIKAGMPVPFAGKLDVTAADPANLRVIECDQDQVGQMVEDVLNAMTRFDRVWETQVITALNEKSDIARKQLNERLGKLLNPDGTGAKGCPFRTGDKVVCLRNTRLKCVVPSVPNLNPTMAKESNCYLPQPFTFKNEKFTEWYVANGEIGRVVAVGEKSSVVRFGGADVPLVLVPNGKRPTGETHEESEDGGRSSDFEPAWAITAHKSQGSEWPCVICVIDDAANSIADRNYWYTAISRARSMGLLIGPKGVFEKQVRKQSIDRRRTFLADSLRVVPVPTPGGAS